MTYYGLLVKKIMKDKLTIIMLLIMMGTIFFVLFQNIRTKPTVSLENMISSNIDMTQKTIDQSKKIINSSKNSQEDKKYAEIDLKAGKDQLNEDQTVLRAQKNDNLERLYGILIKQNKDMLRSFKNGGDDDKETITAIKREGIRLESLNKLKIDYEPEAYPTKSFSFTTELFKYIIPVLFVVMSIFLLVQHFSKSFYNKLDKNKLLPGSDINNLVAEIITGFIALSVMLLVVIVVAFLIAGIGSGFDSPNSPIFEYGINKDMSYGPIWIALLKVAVLFWTCLLTITVITHFLVSLTRNKMVSLLITLLLILGTEILTTIVEPLQTVAHMLPTTYLYSLSVVSGEARVNYNNNLVTFNNGIILMVVVTIVFLGLTILIRKKSIFLKV